ncbi:MAG: S26 family signal peptidase [Sedimentisphaerales bacterium]
MRCQRCQFENMPGESRCFRCGSALGDAAIAVDVHPPRMARWKRPIRLVLRRFRRLNIAPESLPKVPAFLKIMSGNALGGIFLSIVPGLAHLVEGRFREVRWWVQAWFVVLLVGMFFYGGSIGLLFLGFAVGLHTWIAFNHALMKEHIETNQHLVDFVMLLVFFGLLYFGVRATVFRDFVMGFSSRTIPYQNVQTGDIMLARRSRAQPNLLKRGSFVLVNLNDVGNGNWREWRWRQGRGEMVVQIVALGGETVDINNAFVVNGRPLDEKRFPVPQWLRRNIRQIQVPEGSYFINVEYNIQGNAAMNEGLIKSACVIEGSRIEAAAVMRWLPLSRRGFLRAEE